MHPMSSRRWKIIGSLLALVVVLDQLTKWWALTTLEPYVAPRDDRFFQFRLVYNSGTAFSMGAGNSVLIVLLVVVICLALLWYATKVHTTFALVAIGVLLGGACGNLIDRLTRGSGSLNGKVVDFIDIKYWAVFNVADIAVTCGAICLALSGFIAGASPVEDNNADAPSPANEMS